MTTDPRRTGKPRGAGALEPGEHRETVEAQQGGSTSRNPAVLVCCSIETHRRRWIMAPLPVANSPRPAYVALVSNLAGGRIDLGAAMGATPEAALAAALRLAHTL